MASGLADRKRSVLIVIDLQDAFLAPIESRDEVIERAAFIIKVAKILQVPILVTEQYATRMGHTTSEIAELLDDTKGIDKLCFSSCKSDEFNRYWKQLNRDQAIVVGIETHICVNQTVHDLLESNCQVFVCEDAVSARGEHPHGNAIGRMAGSGAIIAHTESIAYEWVGSANTAQFKHVLNLVKEYPP